MSEIHIAARLRAEPGWRAVLARMPIQAVSSNRTTNIHIEVVRFVEWAVEASGHLWPIGHRGRPVPRGELVRLVEPECALSDSQLILNMRDQIQSKVHEIEATQPESDADE